MHTVEVSPSPLYPPPGPPPSQSAPSELPATPVVAHAHRRGRARSLGLALSGSCGGYLPAQWIYAGIAPAPGVPHHVLLPQRWLRPMTDAYLRATGTASVWGGVAVGIYLGLQHARCAHTDPPGVSRLFETLVSSLGVGLFGSLGAPAAALLGTAAWGTSAPASIDQPALAYLLAVLLFGLGAACARPKPLFARGQH